MFKGRPVYSFLISFGGCSLTSYCLLFLFWPSLQGIPEAAEVPVARAPAAAAPLGAPAAAPAAAPLGAPAAPAGPNAAPLDLFPQV